MKQIKEIKKFTPLSKEELNLLKGGQKNYLNPSKKGDWELVNDTYPPHD